MKSGVLPMHEHIQVLVEGEAHEQPCDDYDVSQIDMQLPPWFKKDKFKRGQEYIKRNLFSQFVTMLCGLISVLAIPSILKILINTHKSSTVTTAYRRYLSTIKHVNSWYLEDLQPGTTSWRSLSLVRVRHLRASRTSQSSGGDHISQRDMVLTQFGFFGFGFLRPQLLGLDHDCVQDLEGYLHFWRTIGYMLGIDDRYNLCRPSLEETREVAEAVSSQIYLPQLMNPPEYFYFMVSTLLKSMWYFSPTISQGPFLYLIYRLLGVEGFDYPTISRPAVDQNTTQKDTKEHKTIRLINENEYYNKLCKTDKCLISYMLFTFQKLMYTFIGRWYFVMQIRITIFLVTYFPFLCFRRFGLRGSFVDMFAEDVPVRTAPKTNSEMLEVM